MHSKVAASIRKINDYSICSASQLNCLHYQQQTLIFCSFSLNLYQKRRSCRSLQQKLLQLPCQLSLQQNSIHVCELSPTLSCHRFLPQIPLVRCLSANSSLSLSILNCRAFDDCFLILFILKQKLFDFCLISHLVILIPCKPQVPVNFLDMDYLSQLQLFLLGVIAGSGLAVPCSLLLLE